MDSTFCYASYSISKQKTTYNFVVDNFSHREGDKPIQSPSMITIPNVSHFELVLYPSKANLREISNCSLIYVRNYFHPSQLTYGTSEKTIFHCEISILNKINEKCYTKVGQLVIKDRKIESDWFYCISRDYLTNAANGLLPNNTLTILCEISVMDQLVKPSLEIVQQKHNSMSSDFKSLFESKKCSDVVLISGVTEFPAHKSILSARSPVFGAMFEHECEEKKQNQILITDIEPEVIAELLMYIYTGTVSSLEKYSDELLVAADKYQIESLKSICEESLSRELTVESTMKLLVLSDMHNATNLKVNCLNYISSHPTEVTTEDWNAVCSARPDLTFKLFSTVASKK